jgi:mannonate dehydratase
MKLGFGFYRHMLDADHFRFARQCGATHAVVHLVDYFNQGKTNTRTDQPIGDLHGWGCAGDPGKLWSVEELRALKAELNQHGLEWEAVENFDPAHWHDILLDGPKKAEQLENVKTLIRRLGEVGVRVLGYNFSLAGVAGRIKGPFARGGAEAVGMDGPVDDPIPNGMVWNMTYNASAPKGFLAPISHEEFWQRFAFFLNAVLPTAEEAGVTLALHPDDPPMPNVRGQPRLVYQPRFYQKVVDINPSPRNAMEFCVGTVAEMTEGAVEEAVDCYSRQGRIAYVHLRNIRGKVPHYRETFIDEGDVNVGRVLRILHRNGFDGVIIPDHAPAMTCGAPWHAGMAFAMGYLKARMEEATHEH